MKQVENHVELEQKVVFLDRDGVLNQARHHESGDARNYVTSWEEFVWIEGSKQAVIRLLEHGYAVVVVSNHAGVAKGIITAERAGTIMYKMWKDIEWDLSMPGEDIQLFAAFFCPHSKEDECGCRKPEPGMLYAAAYEHNLSLKNAWMIGDSEDDLQAGFKAGLRKLILIDETYPYPFSGLDAYVQFLGHSLAKTTNERNLSNAVTYILEREKTDESVIHSEGA